jgi:membrane fusion protein
LPPFLDTRPPHWAARGLASILLALFAVSTVAAFAVRIPESLAASFVLIPIRGGDPVRAFRSGVVTEVRIVEAQTVARGDSLYTIASAAVGDRAAEWKTLDSQIRSLEERLATRRERDASQRRADEEEAGSVEDRIQSLPRTIALTRQRLATVREVARRQKQSFDEGLSSWVELGRAQVDADNLALESEREEAEQDAARRSLKRLREQANARRAESREIERGLAEELDRARIRKLALDQDLVHEGNRLAVSAPCEGSVVKLMVRSQGAVVQEGDVLAEVTCGADRLQAELSLPQAGVGSVRPGQQVKLLYAAYPYERYGARNATIRWVSPSGDTSGLRAFADLESDSVLVSGQRRSLLPGMSGRARVILGRRALVSYAFEPIRQIRENLAVR